MSPRRLHKKLSRCWETYGLEIGPDYLLRRQGDTPDIRLAFSEIKRIERRPGEYVRIVGNQKLHVIGIPEGIEHFDEVWQVVSALAPTTPVTRLQQIRTVLAYALGGAFPGGSLEQVASNLAYLFCVMHRIGRLGNHHRHSQSELRAENAAHCHSSLFVVHLPILLKATLTVLAARAK